MRACCAPPLARDCISGTVINIFDQKNRCTVPHGRRVDYIVNAIADHSRGFAPQFYIPVTYARSHGNALGDRLECRRFERQKTFAVPNAAAERSGRSIAVQRTRPGD